MENSPAGPAAHFAETPVALDTIPLTVSFLDGRQLALPEEELDSLPEGVRRQMARFLLRWGRGGEPAARALALLPERPVGPRDRFDRCRALIAAGDVEAARDLARDLVNARDAGPWGHRAVGEVFLAMGKADRADERFLAAGDPAGRARAWLLLGKPERALELLDPVPEGDVEAEWVRLEALRRVGAGTDRLEAALRHWFDEEYGEIVETLGPAAGQFSSVPRSAWRLPGPASCLPDHALLAGTPAAPGETAGERPPPGPVSRCERGLCGRTQGRP